MYELAACCLDQFPLCVIDGETSDCRKVEDCCSTDTEWCDELKKCVPHSDYCKDCGPRDNEVLCPSSPAKCVLIGLEDQCCPAG